MFKKLVLLFGVAFYVINAQGFRPFVLSYYDFIPAVKSLLGESPNVIEEGAFNGTDSVLLAEAWPKGHIYSSEPVPDLYRLASNKVKDYKNVTLVNKARPLKAIYRPNLTIFKPNVEYPSQTE